jgi:hypothetical protein
MLGIGRADDLTTTDDTMQSMVRDVSKPRAAMAVEGDCIKWPLSKTLRRAAL